MSNVFTEIGHGIEVGAEDVAKGVVKVITFTEKAESVIATAIKDQPAIKDAVLSLVQEAEKVIADGAIATADKGIDLTADASTLADAESFFGYFKNTFIPLVEQLYSEVKTDLTVMTTAPATS